MNVFHNIGTADKSSKGYVLICSLSHKNAYSRSRNRNREDGVFVARLITGAGLQAFVALRQYLTNNYYGVAELKRLYAVEPMSDYIGRDAVLGGYAQHGEKPTKKHLRRDIYFVYG